MGLDSHCVDTDHHSPLHRPHSDRHGGDHRCGRWPFPLRSASQMAFDGFMHWTLSTSKPPYEVQRLTAALPIPGQNLCHDFLTATVLTHHPHHTLHTTHY